MRRPVALMGRVILAAAAAYLVAGLAWQTAFDLALTASAADRALLSPWSGPMSFLAWFAIPAMLWPAGMSAFLPRGELTAIVLFIVLAGLMFAALSFVTRRAAARV